MDNIFCIIGTVSLFICLVIAFYYETDSGKMKKEQEKLSKPAKFYDVYSYLVFFAILSVSSFILCGVVLYLNGHLW